MSPSSRPMWLSRATICSRRAAIVRTCSAHPRPPSLRPEPTSSPERWAATPPQLNCTELAMSTTAAKGVRLSAAAAVQLSRPAPGIIAALFCGYLAVGLPLPVIPLFVHDSLGFGNLIVGLVIGIQFLATVLTRGYAGRLTDRHGGRRSALQGAAVCSLGGLLYLIAAMPGLSPAISLAVIVVGRLVAGFGESQLVTGGVSWSIASVGPPRAGMSMSWTGIAMFAALAIGAPIGMALYQSYGLEAAMVACIVAPLIAAVIAFRERPYA